ncbi:MAG: hypothetical protein NTW96_27685 [Planctomycetia bacterium]|nr:hypothetical protein [Planctomycetia bacterium]
MPYILPQNRECLDDAIERLASDIHQLRHLGRAGLLNYAVFRIVSRLLGIVTVGDMSTRPPVGEYGYSDLNEMIGALECCKLELYRRIASPYEDKKAAENGEIGD